MADKSLKNKMRILELEKPLGALLSAVDAMEGGKLSKKRKTRAKLIELKDKLGMEMGGEVMDMTKSEPVNMMEEGGSAVSDADVSKAKKMLVKKSNLSDADIQRMETLIGKVKPKKMNMGGVVPGRGGSFKGVK